MQYTSDDGGADYAAQHPAEEYAAVIIEEARYIHKDKLTKSAHALISLLSVKYIFCACLVIFSDMTPQNERCGVNLPHCPCG